MRQLVWFRSDLRVDDNPALSHALRSSTEGVIGVFFCCPEQWRAHDWGAPKVDFVLRSVQELSGELSRLGVALLVETVPTFAEVPQRISDLVRQHECERVSFNLEYEVNERRRDAALTRLLQSHGVPVETFEDQTILPPASLQTGKGTFFTVFSPFRRAWMRRLEETGIPAHPASGSHAGRLLATPSEVPDALDGFDSFDAGDLWPAGEREARERLDRFISERSTSYSLKRDLAAEDGTSTLSPYLALGVLSIRRCLAAALAANAGRLEGGDKGVETWITELVWREFYRHVLVGFPRVSKNRAFKQETESIAWRYDEELLDAWRRGQTGFPFVDAGMRQLLATGWMHNRLRMVTATFLTKDLLLDWRLGEAHFMRHLVDADLANNNGGWQWSASTGTDAAPYFRIFNPWTQGKRYDAEGDYIRRWLPELADIPAARLHNPKGLSSVERAALGYPEPIVDHASARLRALEAFQTKDSAP